MVHVAANGWACVKTGRVILNREGEAGELGYAPVVASPAIDAWALATVLFHMSTGQKLFNTNQEDNLDQQDLRALAAWSDDIAKNRVAEIQHRLARNLVQRLLVRDPDQRLSMEAVLQHPFVTGQPAPGRLDGEEAIYDVFLS